MKFGKSIVALVVAGLPLSAVAQDTCPASKGSCPNSATTVVSTSARQDEVSDIVTTAVGNESFSTLVAAVKAAGLVETLQGKGPFTVFAPTNEAFAKIPQDTLNSLLLPENKDQLVNILTYHVVPGKVLAADVVGLSEAKTAQGQKIMIKVEVGKVYLNEKTQVVATDVLCSNGVIHVIDNVILPPAETATSEMEAKDIIDTAVDAGSFGTLAAAIEAAGLVETLKGDGPFTVFAPTDEAFAKLPEGTVAELLKPENKDKLVSILTYHVVSGKVMAETVVGLKSADTVQGSPVKIRVEDGAVILNKDCKVLKTDINCKNGVIHVIDSVILPPNG